jgi:hypothetical protein
MIPGGMVGLRRAAIVLPVAWTGAWLGYYGVYLSAIAFASRDLAQSQPTRIPFDDRISENEIRSFKRR